MNDGIKGRSAPSRRTLAGGVSALVLAGVVAVGAMALRSDGGRPDPDVVASGRADPETGPTSPEAVGPVTTSSATTPTTSSSATTAPKPEASACPPDTDAPTLDRLGLWTVGLEGRVRLLSGHRHEVFGWSPDGSRLAIGVQEEGGWTLGVIARDGGPILPLAPGHFIRQAKWAPDGRRILFTAETESGWGPHDLYLVDAAGGPVTTLWHDDALFVWTFEGLDGERALFYTNNGDNYLKFPEGLLNTVKFDGSDRREVATKVGSAFRLSPDGRSVATIVEGSRAVVDVATGSAVLLGRAYEPDQIHDIHDGPDLWSPDSAWVTFHWGGQIDVYHADGKPTWTWGGSMRNQLYEVVFSPDSRRLAGSMDEDDGWLPEVLVVANADGSRRRVVREGNLSPIAWLTPDVLALVSADEAQERYICKVPGSVTGGRAIARIAPALEDLTRILLSPDRKTFVVSLEPPSHSEDPADS